MKKFNEFSLTSQYLAVYLISIFIALLLSPLFNKLHELVYNLNSSQGFFSFNEPYIIDVLLNGGFFAYLFILPFIIFIFIKTKSYLSWTIGAFIPFLMTLSVGIKDLFIAILLSLSGWLLAQIILFIKQKLEKNNY